MSKFSFSFWRKSVHFGSESYASICASFWIKMSFALVSSIVISTHYQCSLSSRMSISVAYTIGSIICLRWVVYQCWCSTREWPTPFLSCSWKNSSHCRSSASTPCTSWTVSRFVRNRMRYSPPQTKIETTHNYYHRCILTALWFRAQSRRK